MQKEWEEAARVCMTHSYVLMREAFDYEPSQEEQIEIKKYIMNCTADDYDRLIQLCDSLAAMETSRKVALWEVFSASF
jgi:hypothetical protein